MTTDKIEVSPDVFRLATPEERQHLVVRTYPPPINSSDIIAATADKKKFLKQPPSGARRGNKYGVADKPDRTYNGKVYHSKKEAEHARDNDLRIKAGDLSFYLEQVPIDLGGGVKYKLDFLEFRTVHFDEGNDPTDAYNLYDIHWIEVKPDVKPGKKKFRIPEGEAKRKIAEARLGIKIEVV